MSDMIITSAGLLAISNADAGGFKINITTFSVSGHQYSAEPSPSSTKLNGSALYTGNVQSVERLDNASVRYECTIPADKPTTGSYTIGEIGLYLDTGELFALGRIDPSLNKRTGLAFTIFPIISASRLSGVVNVTVSDTSNLSTTIVNRLPKPTDSLSNAVILSDANRDYESPFVGASVALKTGDAQWSFLGFHRVANLTVRPITNSSFSIDPNTAGFWLNDSESVIVQIVQGPGAGQSRIFKYRKEFLTVSHVFEAELPLTSFTSDSVLTIWRNNSVDYPDRRGIPSSHVLYAGEDTISSTWDTSSPVSGSLKVASYYTRSLTNQFQFALPSSLPKSYQDRNNILLFIDGILAPFDDYSVYNQTLVTRPLPDNTQLSFYVFYRVDGVGSTFKLYEELIEQANIYDYNGNPSYNLPIVPENVDASIGFTFRHGQPLEIPHAWTIDGPHLVFNKSPTADTLLLVWGLEEAFGGYSIPIQYEWLYSPRYFDSKTNSYIFRLVETPTDSTYLLFVNGRILQKSKYTVSGASITISKSNVVLNDGDTLRFIWILNKFGIKQEVSEALVKFNKISQHCSTYISPSEVYKASSPPINDNHVLVFIKGFKQEKDVDWRLKGTNVIEFQEPIPDGYPVDIISFTEEETKGHLLTSEVYSLELTNSLSYTIPLKAPPDQDAVMIFIEGLYCHKSEFSIIGNTSSFDIQFTRQPLEGSCADIIIFRNTELAESRSSLIQSRPHPYIGFRRFTLDSKTVVQANSLLFVGPVYQHKSTYQIRGPEVVFNQIIPYEQSDPSNYDLMRVEFFAFDSGKDLDKINRELIELSYRSKPARNTGPFWADPAGINKSPNSMSMSVSSVMSGPTTTYTFTPPYSSSSIFVFLHGALQYNNVDYVFTNLNQIKFSSEIPNGYPVDIITFQCREELVGYELDIKVFETISNLSNSYAIAYELDDPQTVMVFVEGIYFHRSWYSLSIAGKGFRLSFIDGLLENLKIEVCIWHQVECEGSYTEMITQLPNPTVGAKNIVLREEVKKNNTFVFAGPLYQSKHTYSVNAMTLMLDTPINYEYIDPLNYKDMPITVCSFRSGKSKTRLITRDELRDNYLTRHGGDLLGPLYTTGDPESDLEVANKHYVDAIRLELEAMRKLLANLQGQAEDATYKPLLAISPNLIRLNDVVVIKISNASPGKRVELEVRGASGIYNERSVKGLTKLDGTFTLGPVGIDSGFADYLTVTAWVDGFRVANTVDVKVTDTLVVSGQAMISCDREIYNPYDYITLSIADGVPGGRVTWSVNGASPTAVPVGQPSFIGTDGTWSMQIPAGGVPTNYIVELFVDNLTVGTLSIIVSPSRSEKVPNVSFGSTEIYRDEVIDIKVSEGTSYGSVTFSAKAVGAGRSGPTDTAGLLNTDGQLNFGFRFTSPGSYIIYVTVNRNLYTHKLTVKKVSPSDPLITEQPEGYRAYIKQY